jgi:predicted DNA-binding helix-hairpin-helix protein
VLPGASFHLVEHATALADRVSINLEAPTPEHLKRVAPDKDFVEDLLKRMKWVGSLIRNSSYAKSHTTQFVVGSSDESDLEILKTVDWIYRELYLFRAYFSAFQPVEESSCLLPRETSPLDRNQSLLREHRLYQSDFLLRGYGFRLHDLVFDSQGQLPSGVDPKTAYAIMHPEFYPVDINRASEQELLKVPGIGPLSARRIVETRVQDTFRSLSELRRVGAFVNRAAPYLEFSGRAERSSETDYTQRWLFERARPEDWRTGFEPYQKEK